MKTRWTVCPFNTLNNVVYTKFSTQIGEIMSQERPGDFSGGCPGVISTPRYGPICNAKRLLRAPSQLNVVGT